MQCEHDWFDTYGERALNHFGRITQPIVLQENNAWRKRYRWGYRDNDDRYIFYNIITTEERPLTESQYNDSNYTLNER